MFTNSDQSGVIVSYLRISTESSTPMAFLCLNGIDVTKQYEVVGTGNL